MDDSPTNEDFKIHIMSYNIIMEHTVCTVNDIDQQKSERHTAMTGIRHLGSLRIGKKSPTGSQMELLSIKTKTNAELHT